MAWEHGNMGTLKSTALLLYIDLEKAAAPEFPTILLCINLNMSLCNDMISRSSNSFGF